MPPAPLPPAHLAETPPLREAFQQFMRLLRLVRRYWGALFQGMVLGVVLGLLALAVPYLSKLLIDEVYPSGNLSLMHLLVLGILGVSMASAIMTGIRLYFTSYTINHLANASTLLFFNHLQHLRTRFFDQHRVGELINRFIDVRVALTTVARVLETVFSSAVYLLLVPPFLFLLQRELAMVALVTVPLTVAITVGSAGVLRRYWKKTVEAYAELDAIQLEVLSHIRTLKAMATEHLMYARASRAMQGALQMQLKAGGYSQVFAASNAIVASLGIAVYTWYAWMLIIRGEMTLGDYVAFTAYVGFLTGPLMQITTLFTDFQRSAVGLGRMFDYLDQPAEQDPTLAYAPPPPIATVVRGEISMRGVCFGYSAEREVLHDVSVCFPRGAITAIVGPSGAGKSSLLRLILRMEEPDAGEVCVDGAPISSLSIPDLRRQVAVVWQEFSLVQGTIWENLTLGSEEPSRARVDDAVRLCRLKSFIDELPDGYDTPVGEWGATLSGGQRQRFALVRALVRDAPVLLLDEAMANVDMQTETLILRDLLARQEEK
ncbi:MAG TPA: ABC transporter ATP-binding protein, partial [Longimicrobiaceae bacterium]|nr:ABC transporter ATP-binding protein [Longimicrobiaceae bacterium]